jgi:hypothetical protein
MQLTLLDEFMDSDSVIHSSALVGSPIFRCLLALIERLTFCNFEFFNSLSFLARLESMPMIFLNLRCRRN